MRLSRDDVLKADDRVTEEVVCPEWGGSVLVRGMTGRERDSWEVSLRDQRSGQRIPGRMNNIRSQVIVRCIVDDDGARLFTDADVAALGEKSGAAIDRVYDVAARLSGLSEEDEKEMAEDFGGEGGGSSSTASPSGSGKPSKSSSAR
jgi:hypothetical protein